MPPPKDTTPPPTADQFVVGDKVVTLKEIHPKVPAGVLGIVEDVRTDINQITITWNIPLWPYIKVTVGSPTNGIGKAPE